MLHTSHCPAGNGYCNARESLALQETDWKAEISSFEKEVAAEAGAITAVTSQIAHQLPKARSRGPSNHDDGAGAEQYHCITACSLGAQATFHD